MRRLHERGEAQARSARPRVLAAADKELFWWSRERPEAARAHSAADAQLRVLRGGYKEAAE